MSRPVFHRHIGAGAGDDDYGRHVAAVERGVDVALERDWLAAANPLIGGDHRAGIAIGDAPGQAFRREAAEDDRMDRADPRAGEHRRRRLGDHRHVDHDAVAPLEPADLRRLAKRQVSS